MMFKVLSKILIISWKIEDFILRLKDAWKVLKGDMIAYPIIEELKIIEKENGNNHIPKKRPDPLSK